MIRSLLLVLCLLAPSIGWAQGTIVVRRAAGGAPSIPDEWDEWVAGWAMDESTGSRVAIAATTCGAAGSDCDLSETNSVAQDTTNKVEGTAAADFVNTNSEQLDCTAATCNEIVGLTGSVSFFSFVRHTSEPGNVQIAGTESTGSGGWWCRRRSATDDLLCDVFDAGGGQTFDSVATLDLNTYYFIGMDADGVNDTADVYIDGACDTAGGCGSVSQGDIVASSEDFTISNNFNSGTYMEGQIDLTGIYAGSLTDGQWCYTCSCAPGNEFGCSASACSAGSFSGTGQNSTQCGSCSLATVNPCDPY